MDCDRGSALSLATPSRQALLGRSFLSRMAKSGTFGGHVRAVALCAYEPHERPRSTPSLAATFDRGQCTEGAPGLAWPGDLPVAVLALPSLEWCRRRYPWPRSRPADARGRIFHGCRSQETHTQPRRRAHVAAAADAGSRSRDTARRGY